MEFTNWLNDVKLAAGVLVASILIVAGLVFVDSRQTREADQDFIMSSAVSIYDLNGDGLVTEADAAIYAKMFNRINFNNDAQVDIFDQVLLSGEVQEVYVLYLPVIFK